MILRDFKCEQCGKIFEDLVQSKVLELQCACGAIAHYTITKANLSNVVDFNSHYDLQLGRHFESREEKNAFLKETGREQISGYHSPRSSNKTNVICNKTQALKEFGPNAPKNEKERQIWKQRFQKQ